MKKQLLILATLFISYFASAQVGVGTTSPTEALDVETSDATKTAIDINNTGGGDPKINLQLNGTTNFSIGVDNDDADKLKIGTSAPETNTRVTIDNTGNVGIGTTSPTRQLDVEGQVTIHPTGTNADNIYNGQLIITKPAASGQYINLIRSQRWDWSIGYVYNTNNFAIGNGEINDADFSPEFTIDTDGNVGIGTTTPTQALDVETNEAGGTAIDINNTGTGDPKINLQLNGTTNFSIGVDNDDADKLKIGTSAPETNTRVTIDNTGNVGIGTTSPVTKLEVQNGDLKVTDDAGEVMLNQGGAVEIARAYSGGAAAYIDFKDDISDDYDCRIYQHNANGLAFNVNGFANAIYIESDGDVGIGTTSPDQKLSVNGNASKVGGGSWATFSDRRLKKNIYEFSDGLDKLMQINPVSFQYNGLAGYTNDSALYIGVIAQDVEKVAPYMIEHVQKKLNESDSVTTDLLMYDGSALTYILVNAVKEQQAIINAQKAEIDILKANALKIADLENKMNAMLLLLNKKEEVTAKQ